MLEGVLEYLIYSRNPSKLCNCLRRYVVYSYDFTLVLSYERGKYKVYVWVQTQTTYTSMADISRTGNYVSQIFGIHW